MLVGFFGVGHFELLVVAFVILLLFGNRLPGLMRSMGRGVVEFKHGLHGVDTEDDDAEPPSKPKKTEKIKAE